MIQCNQEISKGELKMKELIDALPMNQKVKITMFYGSHAETFDLYGWDLQFDSKKYKNCKLRSIYTNEKSELCLICTAF